MTHQVDKFIVCDIIRTEDTKKAIIIGMYTEDTIVVNIDMPYIHHSLGFMVRITDIADGNYSIKTTIEHDNKILFHTDKQNTNIKNNSIIITSNIANILIPSAGEYFYKIHFNDELEISLLFLLLKQKHHLTKNVVKDNQKTS